MSTTSQKQIVWLGNVTMTSGIHEAITEKYPNVNAGWAMLKKFIFRHSCGDWGDVCKEDKESNDLASSGNPDTQARVVSVYEETPIGKIWIITEADRSVTTVLFPSEY